MPPPLQAGGAAPSRDFPIYTLSMPPQPLQAALVDPLPEVRATAAKALGSLVKGALD